MKKIVNNISAFILAFVMLLTITIASSLYSADSIILSDDSALQNAIEDLYSKKTDCPAGYACFLKHNEPQVGDYLQMTPTLRSFTTDKTKTGNSSSQTIYPYKVNLWRVIRKNSDGTIEVVSAKSTTESITFRGSTGYMNYIGYLNVLASKYENSNYTVGSRHMGYSNQTEYITDSSRITVSKANAWTCSTGGSCHPENQENLGGGDTGYTTDYNLVNSIGALNGMKDYFLASRYVSGGWYYGRVIKSGSLSTGYLAYWSSSDSLNLTSSTYYLRPILVLKANINYVPSAGTIDYPFILD